MTKWFRERNQISQDYMFLESVFQIRLLIDNNAFVEYVFSTPKSNRNAIRNVISLCVVNSNSRRMCCDLKSYLHLFQEHV